MRVELHPTSEATRWAVLRPLCGHDELTIDPELPGAGARLLGRLLAPVPGAAVGPESVTALTIGDRDRLLAAVHRACFGDRIEAITTCSACEQQFAVVFLLSDLTAHLGNAHVRDVPDDDGFFRAPDGVRFRLPTVADLAAIVHLVPERAVAALLRRCVADDAAHGDAHALQAAMERLAPTLDIDVEARCPHCDVVREIAFSLESHLVQALALERRFLTSEVHRLAVAYGWGLREILDLSREDRRALLRHVEAERAEGIGR